MALGDLGFLSLYRLSDSRHQILGLSKTGFTRPSGLRFGRILYPEASPRNSPQLSQLDFFRLTSSSGRNLTIFKKRSETNFIFFLRGTLESFIKQRRSLGSQPGGC